MGRSGYDCRVEVKKMDPLLHLLEQIDLCPTFRPKLYRFPVFHDEGLDIVSGR
jgi:hypothetical protein